MTIHGLPESHCCPCCDGTAMLCTDSQPLSYKGESFTVTAYYYKCNKCQEEFTTTESDEATLAQIPGFPSEPDHK
jgi:hypothetical protein